MRVATLFATAWPALPHPAFPGELDFLRAVTFERVVTRVDWENPQPGDKVVVHDFLARNGSHSADGRQVTPAADLRKILPGQNY